MTLCAAWLRYQGLRLGLRMHEIPHTRVGEILELIECDAITHGAPAKGTQKLTTEQALRLG